MKDKLDQEKPTESEYVYLMGRPRKFSSPGELKQSALNYFKWVNDNPFVIEVPTKFGGVPVQKRRPLSIVGFCNYVGMHKQTFYDYASDRDNKYTEYSDIISHIRGIIEQDQLEGGIGEVYNANIISRLLGLADKQEVSSDTSIKVEVSNDKAKNDLENELSKLA